MMPRLLHLILFASLLPLSAGADAAARAFLDRGSITLGETVTLNIESDSMAAAQPDLSVLEANFRLLGTSSSSQLQLINGRQTARQLWAVALEPLAEGVIGIPSLSVGGSQTEPLTLTVLPAPQGASGGAGDDVFLEVEALPLDPYVQQQVRYVVRLHYAVNLAEGQLEEPQVDGARLQRMGSDTRYQRRISDRRYEVIERRYALIPERSGRLQVSAPRFRGAAIDGSRGGFFGGGRRLQANGDAVTLDVRAQPAAAPAPWLPALELALVDESGALDGQYRVGEPITLSVRLTARGLGADQLPELNLPPVENAQVYPDLESSQTGDAGEWLSGERLRRFAIVPARPGTLQIPALRISWWNTQTDRIEHAEIAARQLSVAPAVGVDAASEARAAAPDTDRAQVTTGGAGVDSRPLTVWHFASALFALLWLATLAWFIRPRRAARVTPSTASQPAADLSRLRQALEQGDLPEVARQLRALSAAGRGAGLDSLSERLLDPRQAELVASLERRLYASEPGEDRQAFLQQLRQAFRQPPRWRVEARSDASTPRLPPLYRA